MGKLNIPRYYRYYQTNAFQLKPEPNENDVATVSIQMALMKDGEGDWENTKIHFQFKPEDELTDLCCFMIGIKSKLELSGHGKSNNKQLSMTRNENQSIYVCLKEGAQSYTIVLPATSAWHLGVISINQLRHRFSITFNEAMNMLRMIKL